MSIRSACRRSLILFMLLIVPAPLLAAPFLSIASPSADGVFVLRGEQMAGVAGLDITIGYDRNTLSTPHIAMGSLVKDMLNSSNPSNPIRLAIVGSKGIATASGVIATITFERVGESAGAITSLTASLIDEKGNKLPIAPAAIDNPQTPTHAEPSAEAPPADGAKDKDEPLVIDATSHPSRPAPVVLGGSVTLPHEEVAPAEPKRAPQEAERQEVAELQPHRREPAPVEPRDPEPKAAPQAVTQPVHLPSVLDRFREFKGERTLANLTSLFKAAGERPLLQIPAIAIADGSSTVTLVIAMETGDRPPVFAFKAVRYVSVSRSDEGEWEVEVRPEAGVVDASITMLYHGLSQEFPLIVAPAVRLPAAPEAAFRNFLAAGADLNGDGRVDYLDDYIFTANFLAQSQEPAQQKE
ncbi:cohesin domain-containing protein [Citrifermentans bremense]|uniref:cohesin domain-containing protein n=1 Tax=Citrifermentans bremense TaxID=60035 RepID=UPI00047E8BC9|nr:cohesin domain-containing protein [Citrifermentans bremense]